ncbi:hypothetical protein C8R46DRAFT_1045720 [Mycena filopes]|nr:hypothetical protein C8R46DRAFT_1045720 [Mycena filopes]
MNLEDMTCGRVRSRQGNTIAAHQKEISGHWSKDKPLSQWSSDGFWVDTTLQKLGLIYQLGHQGGRCLTPNPTIRKIVVYDTGGVYEVRYRRCGCDRADHMNPVKELLQNGWFPASATDPDACATITGLDTFRYLAVVANVNAHDYVTVLEHLTCGIGAAQMKKIPDRYKVFLRMAREFSFLQIGKHAGRAHDPKGLAATKVGECAVVCWTCPYDGRNLVPGWRDVDPKYRYLYRLILALDANFKLKNHIRVNERHNPPLGPGWGSFVELTKYHEHLKNYVPETDVSSCIVFAALTQKETRNTAGLRVSGVGGYANTMSAFGDFNLMELTFSYDIACQWQKNLRERVQKLPADMRPDFEAFLLQCGVPVWHTSSHEAECTNRNSLSFVPGAMGLGHRADTIEDKINYHNFMKNLGQANMLQRKLVVAIAERARQVEAFKQVNKDKEEAAARGNTPLHGTSATAFLTAGLQLEDLQRCIKAEISEMTLVTADRESKLQELRLALLSKLHQFRVLQDVYTLVALRLVEEVERKRVADAPAVKAENIRLFLPSALTEAERTTGCKEGLAEMEARLRKGQCTDSLTGGNAGGQYDATRSGTLTAQITERVNATAENLKGPNYRPDLKDTDLTLDGDVVDSQSAMQKKLSTIAAGKDGRVPRHVAGTSKKVMSWIWAARGALDPGEPELHECGVGAGKGA